MTFDVEFHAEDAMFRFVAYYVRGRLVSTDPEEMLAFGAAALLACAAALESGVNGQARAHAPFSDWDRLNLRQKVTMLYEIKGPPPNWGRDPYQSVARLIRLRNWLAHFKEPLIGLVNSDGEWLKAQGYPAPPVLDPQVELAPSSLKRFYEATREGCALIADLHGDEWSAHHLRAEDWQALFS